MHLCSCEEVAEDAAMSGSRREEEDGEASVASSSTARRVRLSNDAGTRHEQWTCDHSASSVRLQPDHVHKHIRNPFFCLGISSADQSSTVFSAHYVSQADDTVHHIMLRSTAFSCIVKDREKYYVRNPRDFALRSINVDDHSHYLQVSRLSNLTSIIAHSYY
jgi:hypothetical protein